MVDNARRPVSHQTGAADKYSAVMPASGADRRPAALQALLTDLCGAPVAVERWERLEPWAIARVLLEGAGAGRTAIVKWVRTGTAQARTEPWRLHAELAALQFLSDDLGLALAPRVIAADLSAGFLVLEDLAPRVALDGLIRRDGAAACLELLAVFARARGELSAATAGRAGTYHARCATLGFPAPPGEAEGRLARLWDHGREDAAALGAPIAGSAASELIAALEELNAPGPFLALIHGDAESNNILVRESGPADARLIDFESAGYAHALLDAVCLHVPGAGWISVGDPGAAGLADQYRRALARGVPEAQDDRRYGFALAAACTSWALLRLHRFAVLDTRAPGDHSRLQLVETLESAARTAEAHHALPRLGGWLRRTADALRRRWPDADLDLTDWVRFPPYSPRR
jgi:aminoglycoside/choline kinase family phosphotransferase